MTPLSFERTSLVQDEDKASSEQSRKPAMKPGRVRNFDWRPAILRNASLGFILIITVLLIGLLEYASVKLPHTHHQLHANAADLESGLEKKFVTIAGRQGSQTTATTRSLPIGSSAPPSAYLDDSSTYPTDESISIPTTAATAYILTAMTSRTVQTAYLATSLGNSQMATTPTMYESTAPTVYLVSTTTPSAYVPVSEHLVCATPASFYVPLRFQEVAEGCDQQKSTFRGWGKNEVFISTYLPVLLAVLYRLLWTDVATCLALIDPFRQLAGAEGARADKAFFSFYLSRSSLTDPIRSFGSGRWTLFCGSTACLLACLLPALASEAVWADTNYADCTGRDDTNTNNPCPPRMSVSGSVIRVLQAILALLAITVLFVALSLSLCRTKLSEDPSSISTIASVMRNPVWRTDLENLLTIAGADEKLAKKLFAGRKYALQKFEDMDGTPCYRIHPAGHSRENSVQATWSAPKQDTQYFPVSTGNGVVQRSRLPRASWRAMDNVLVMFVSGTFGVILAYYFSSGDTGFNRFFNGGSFGPRFILTLAGTIIAMMWKGIEHDAMILAPYTRLSLSPSRYATTVDFSPTVTPFLSAYRALSNRYFFVTVVTLTTLLGEALNIVISGIPYSPAQYFWQFQLSTFLSLAILALMIVVGIVAMWYRAREVKLPVKPVTLAAKMRYLLGSGLMSESEDWETERKRFELRKVGEREWVVDEVKSEGVELS